MFYKRSGIIDPMSYVVFEVVDGGSGISDVVFKLVDSDKERDPII